jgi:hypothetical protein
MLFQFGGNYTALGIAAQRGEAHLVVRLVRAGADVNYQDSQVTPRTAQRMTKFALSTKVDVNVTYTVLYAIG